MKQQNMMHALAIPTDITDATQIAHLVEQTIEQFGHIDVLVNNAGIGRLKSFFDEKLPFILARFDNAQAATLTIWVG